jgi:hypothetical protein
MLGARVSSGLIGIREMCISCAYKEDADKVKSASKTYNVQIVQCAVCGAKEDIEILPRVRKLLGVTCYYCWKDILKNLNEWHEYVYIKLDVDGKEWGEYVHQKCYDARP